MQGAPIKRALRAMAEKQRPCGTRKPYVQQTALLGLVGLSLGAAGCGIRGREQKFTPQRQKTVFKSWQKNSLKFKPL